MSRTFPALGIRADAGVRIGTGHVMRCLALAQAWKKRGGDVVLYTHDAAPTLVRRLEQEGVQVVMPVHRAGSLEEAREVASLAGEASLLWMVVDGYVFSPEYLAAIKEGGLRLLVLDDLAACDLSAADIVLNQNAYASESMYPKTIRLLAGSRNALLRREFLEWHGRRCSEPEEAVKILVTLGGGDPENVTRKVVELLAGLADRVLSLKIIVGSANPHLESLRQVSAGGHEVEILANPPNLPELMNRADVAISAAGSSCWELACLGLPMLLIITADNQRGVAATLKDVGIAEVLGWHDDFPASDSLSRITRLLTDQPRRARMSTLGRNLVDGHGAARVTEAILHHPLKARHATQADSKLLWDWVNDPGVRASAFDSEHISWEGHLAWFARRLADPSCIIAIIVDGESQPVGQVRFEGEQIEAIVDISVAPAMRGRGYATAVLRLGLGLLFEDPRWMHVLAWIKATNTASQRIFARSGFRCVGEKKMHGGKVVGYHLSRHEFF
jgi:UDP-2,4-diacetamido-2,4,6-trideoxy-beta-L-altropyranose hydrolase